MTEETSEIFRKVFAWAFENDFQIRVLKFDHEFGNPKMSMRLSRHNFNAEFTLGCYSEDRKYLVEEIKHKLSQAVVSFALHELDLK